MSVEVYRESALFRRDYLAWMALHHFLAARYLRELMVEFVDEFSGGSVSLSDLFYEHSKDISAFDSSWLIAPKLEERSDLQDYLFHVIRNVVWKNEARPPNSMSEIEGQAKIKSEAVNLAIELRLRNFRSDFRDYMGVAVASGQDAFITLLSCQGALVDELNAGAFTEESQIFEMVNDLQSPLKYLILKHLGDMCAQADLWNEALLIYRDAHRKIGDVSSAAWSEINRSSEEVIFQSICTALRVTAGASEAAALFRKRFSEGAAENAPVLTANSAIDFQSAKASSASEGEFSRDMRPARIRSPLMLDEYSPYWGVMYSREGKYDDANKEFFKFLMRQTALGSYVSIKQTKLLLAESLIDQISSDDESGGESTFLMASSLLIESCDYHRIASIDWSSGVVSKYVKSDLIEFVIDKSERYEGEIRDRQLATVALFQSWIERSPHEAGSAVSKMLSYMFKVAGSAESSFYSRLNNADFCLNAIKTVAEKRPEFRRHGADLVSSLLSTWLSVGRWWTGVRAAIEAAEAYLDVMPVEQVEKAAAAVIAHIQIIGVGRVPWPLLRPAMAFLVADAVKNASKENPDFGRDVISTILEFGVAQETENTNLLFYIKGFSSELFNNDVAHEQIVEVVERVRRKALNINSSDVVPNIMAILVSSSAAGRDGVADALAGLRAIVESVNGRKSIGFIPAYKAFLYISEFHSKIADDIGVAISEFRDEMTSFFPALEGLWVAASKKPSIFSGSMFDDEDGPSRPAVHNWALATLRFCAVFGGDEKLSAAISLALQNDSLRDAITLAGATLLAGGEVHEEDVGIDRIANEGAEAFYDAIGRRLSAICELGPDLQVRLTVALANRCLMLGPREIDAAIFICVMSYGVVGHIDCVAFKDYMQRLSANSGLSLSLAPVVQKLNSRISEIAQ